MDNPLKDTYVYQKDFKVFIACEQCIRHDYCLLLETYGPPPIYNGEYNSFKRHKENV